MSDERAIARRATLTERERIVALIDRYARFEGLTSETQSWANWLVNEIAKEPFTAEEFREYGPGLIAKREPK